MKMLFKPKAVFKEEREVAAKHFNLVDCRTDLIKKDQEHPSNVPVIGKYSILADYVEYCKDLKNLGLVPVNTPRQQQWSSHISHWFDDLSRFTATTWFNPFENPIVRTVLEKHNGPFFVRYDTKSKREMWKTHAFAKDFKALIEMCPRLMEDYKFENEIIAVREFLKLKTYPDIKDQHWKDGNVHQSFSGQPIVKEFRIHRLFGEELCRHFYWEPFQEVIEQQHGKIDCTEIPEKWLAEIASIADEWSNFYVLDVAQMEDGNWTLIEVNEGQHSGVHSDSMEEYYSRMKEVLTSKFG